jgi:hypothetical protein
MPKIDIILDRLQKVKANGKGRYMACCPAHEDKSPSLLVTEDSSGKVGIHCFAGCGGADVMAAIGLALTDLYPEPLTRDYSRGLPDWKRRDLERELREHRFNVEFAKDHQRQGKPVDKDFQLTVINSVSRIKEITTRLQNNE